MIMMPNEQIIIFVICSTICYRLDYLHIPTRAHFSRKILQNELPSITTHLSTSLRLLRQFFNGSNKPLQIPSFSKHAAMVVLHNLLQLPLIEIGQHCPARRHDAPCLAGHGRATESWFASHNAHVTQAIYISHPLVRLQGQDLQVVQMLPFLRLSLCLVQSQSR